MKCGWPICGEMCEKSPSHLPECCFTVQRGERVSVKHFGISHPIYRCIVVLRCLYQKLFLPKVWKRIDCLEAHREERQANCMSYEEERVNVAQFILKFFKLGGSFSEEDIMRVCGIVTVSIVR